MDYQFCSVKPWDANMACFLPLTVGNIGCDSFREMEIIWQLQGAICCAREHYRVFSEVYLEWKYGPLKSCECVNPCESM